jgi:DNA-directed RNA polymerase specialized sigma24 family protein
MGELVRLPLPEIDEDRRSLSKRGPKPNARYKTEISDEDLHDLIIQYGTFHYKKLKYEYGYDVEKDDAIGEVAVTACEARLRYKGNSNIKTFLVAAFSRRMKDYRKYLHVRQRKYPMASIIQC